MKTRRPFELHECGWLKRIDAYSLSCKRFGCELSDHSLSVLSESHEFVIEEKKNGRNLSVCRRRDWNYHETPNGSVVHLEMTYGDEVCSTCISWPNTAWMLASEQWQKHVWKHLRYAPILTNRVFFSLSFWFFCSFALFVAAHILGELVSRIVSFSNDSVIVVNRVISLVVIERNKQ